MKDFSSLAMPLAVVTKTNVGIKWGEEQEKAFHLIKEELTNAALLAFSNFAKTLKLSVMLQE